MARAMIALVSDQRMQNVIPILQDGASYGELVLVLSKERRSGKPLPRYLGSADDLRAVLDRRLRVSLCDECVDPYSIESGTTVVGSLVEGLGKDDVVVNISGGTKPMAIGALRGAQTKGAVCLYTNTEDGEILWLFPDGSISSEPIRVVGLDVPVYIRAYGEEVASSHKVADLDADQRTWAEVLGDNHKLIYQKAVVPITSAIKKARKEGSGFPVICQVRPARRGREIINRLAQEGLWEWNQSLDQVAITSKLAASFLHGAWVEVYVAMQMQHSGLFDDVRLNVELAGVDGEIDVAAVSNGKLVLIECKSNVQRTQQLAKLAFFRRRLGGPYAQAYYARASEAYATQIRGQCQKIRLNGVFFGAQLRDIGRAIGKNMGILPKPLPSAG